jgi:hypothetical protein
MNSLTLRLRLRLLYIFLFPSASQCGLLWRLSSPDSLDDMSASFCNWDVFFPWSQNACSCTMYGRGRLHSEESLCYWSSGNFLCEVLCTAVLLVVALRQPSSVYYAARIIWSSSKEPSSLCLSSNVWNWSWKVCSRVFGVTTCLLG